MDNDRQRGIKKAIKYFVTCGVSVSEQLCFFQIYKYMREQLTLYIIKYK